ncbi:MAG: hypothetical protein ACT4NY_30575 [Pseudonocardiales bacterium]
MDDEDVAKAVEERRVWLEGHLHQAAERLGTDLSGDNVVNTYDMRSAGSRATEQDGTEVWLRVVLSVPDYQPACRWDGNIAANTVTGVPKPRVLRWADWHDTTNYRGGNMLLRGEVMTLAPETVIAPEGSLHRDPGLPSWWWDNLTQALTTLAAHPVPDHEPVNTIDYVINNTRAHFDVGINRAVFDQVTWTTAHNDLHWGNVTGPELCILDWESWGRAPAGYDASTLLCASLRHPPTATRIHEIFQPVLDNHSGRIALLGAVCRYLALPNEPEEPLRKLGADTITKLSRYVEGYSKPHVIEKKNSARVASKASR